MYSQRETNGSLFPNCFVMNLAPPQAPSDAAISREQSEPLARERGIVASLGTTKKRTYMRLSPTAGTGVLLTNEPAALIVRK